MAPRCPYLSFPQHLCLDTGSAGILSHNSNHA